MADDCACGHQASMHHGGFREGACAAAGCPCQARSGALPSERERLLAERTRAMLDAQLALAEARKDYGAKHGLVVLPSRPFGIGASFLAHGPVRVQGPRQEWILAAGERAYFQVREIPCEHPADNDVGEWQKLEE